MGVFHQPLLFTHHLLRPFHLVKLLLSPLYQNVCIPSLRIAAALFPAHRIRFCFSNILFPYNFSPEIQQNDPSLPISTEMGDNRKREARYFQGGIICGRS